MRNWARRARLVDEPEVAETHIEEAEHLIDGLRRELTGLIEELRPMGFDEEGLAAAVHTYCQDWSRQNGVTLDADIRVDAGLERATQQALFRIV
jgi:signal transduction histidine kinase|tara:strand:+ start:1185 stop:1466 length:282 start_codon:yes stop_codon:yes gene_type:complete